MKAGYVVQWSFCILGLGLTDNSPGKDPEEIFAPPEQVGVHSHGLMQLASVLRGNSQYIKEHMERFSVHLTVYNKALSELSKKRAAVCKTWSGLKRDAQVSAAQSERLQKRAEVLRQQLRALMGYKDSMANRLANLEEKVQWISQPGAAVHKPLDLTHLKSLIGVRTQRLNELEAEVVTQEEEMGLQEQHTDTMLNWI